MIGKRWVVGGILSGAWAVTGVGCADDDTSPVEVHHYRLDTVDVPDTVQEAPLFARDLDGDGFGDNKLGILYAQLRANYPSFGVETEAALRLAADAPWILTLVDRGDGGVGAALSIGDVAGDAVVPPVLEALELAEGDAFEPGELLRGGVADLPFGALTDSLGDGAVGWLQTGPVAMTVGFDGERVTATLGVGIWELDVERIVYPNLAAFFTTKLADPSADYARWLDADGDGTVTALEIAADPLIAGSVVPDLAGRQLSFGVRLAGEPFAR